MTGSVARPQVGRKAPPVAHIVFWISRRDAHSSTVATRTRPSKQLIFGPRKDRPAMAMKPLLTALAHQEVDRHHDLVHDVIADGAVTVSEALAIRESAERVERVVSLAHYRAQLAAALARDIETDSYLSDLGMRAGVYGLVAA